MAARDLSGSTAGAKILVCRDGCGPLNVETDDGPVCPRGHYDPVEARAVPVESLLAARAALQRACLKMSVCSEFRGDFDAIQKALDGEGWQ